ncbi:Mth938-like domain-containing protein [Hydrogenophaga sp.]|uniref:Mth938-like domain-containing protein n=1 Tax=Hydrogenophaga sp. TaxID=1904254 RepID=UPI0035679AD1
MKLHADQPNAQTVTAYGEAWVAINGERHTSSVLLSSTGEKQAWDCHRFEDLSAAHFELLAAVTEQAPELVLFGSGVRLRFVHPALLQVLIARGIGVETMDTPAACRTFNILAGEGRRVVAALLLET